MHPRGSSGFAGWPTRARVVRAAALLLLGSAAVAGCSGSHGGSSAPPSATHAYVRSCGTSKTAANVPVLLEIARGSVSCGVAKAVARSYAQAIRSGKAPGNGGGGPVQVRGWTCQGFATPVVLHTGKASKCTRGGSEILEVLPPPPSPGSSRSGSP